ncbi:peptidylprolyl isomerase [Caulobacter sp. SL161]|uniref:peptidylprolyl isomerase n=1 Tax=Caulobacter sp. SL161 TaxID=2995156 RepID=UPI002273C8D7|nr:peptidylprolyl isomerase [Caulobacter sp. SL161]MCY1647328.1 peptidylprolyl isomerase [Caulobacter sp. SL161]
MMKRRDVLAALGVFAVPPSLASAQILSLPATPIVPGAGDVLVRLDTSLGPIIIALKARQAPLTVANFLRYVDEKRYDGSSFWRAAKAPSAVDYGLIQGGLQGDPKKLLPPIAHEPTTQTGLRHVDGTLSLARKAPGTGDSDFFICVGDAPYLDANTTGEGDNLGFAAFGQVVQGMEIVRKILNLPTPGKATNPVMEGQMLDPVVPIVTARRI